MNSINFKANYIRPAMIYKCNKNVYHPIKTSFVKCDLLNKKDLMTIENISKKWGDGNYVRSMYKYAKNLLLNPTLLNSNSRNIYMVVLPQESYDEIDTKNVLGCALTIERPDHLELEYLQVNPEFIFKKRLTTDNAFLKFIQKTFLCKKQTKYKGIGTEILNLLKTIYSDKNFIEVVPDGIQSGKFYKKNGFKRSCRYANVLEWRKS